MVRGKLNTVKTCQGDAKPRSYSMKAPVMFTTIDNSFGAGFLHVGERHIQVIVTVNGEEVLRKIYQKA